MTETLKIDTMIDKTTEITVAFLAHNTVRTEELPSLIQSIRSALFSNFGANAALPTASPQIQANVEEAIPVRTVPAVPIKKSVTADFIICLEDGKHFKSLKRHLRTSFNMSPEQYRAKWNLPLEYPMVAPNYAATRSTLAKSTGLGRRREEAPVQVIAPPKVSRRKAA